MADATRSELIDLSSNRPGHEALVVATGAAIGATMRWGVGEMGGLDTKAGEFPWTTLIVNVVGCFLIGIAAARLTGLARVGITTGLLGGFTTMSAFAVEANELADAGESTLAAAYVASSLLLGVGAAWCGRRIAAAASASGPAESEAAQ